MNIQQIIFALLLSVISSATFAGDTQWKLCSNKAIAVSMVKYPDHLGQITDLNLLVGVFTSNGKLVGANSGEVELKNANGEPGFKGLVTIDNGSKTVSLKGDVFIPGTVIEINQVLSCKELDANNLFVN